MKTMVNVWLTIAGPLAFVVLGCLGFVGVFSYEAPLPAPYVGGSVVIYLTMILTGWGLFNRIWKRDTSDT